MSEWVNDWVSDRLALREALASKNPYNFSFRTYDTKWRTKYAIICVGYQNLVLCAWFEIFFIYIKHKEAKDS